MEFNNPDQATQLRDQIQRLEEEVLNAYRLGARARKAADVPDRARKAVSGALTRAIAKFEKASPTLGVHLRCPVMLASVGLRLPVL